MKDIFASLYELLKSFYGSDLADHLYGYQDGGIFNGASLYPIVGLTLFVGTVVLVILYYYALNKSRFSRWYHWFTALLLNALLQWFIAFYLPYQDKRDGLIAQEIDAQITADHCIGFGLVNMIYSIVLFFLLSIFLKRWSSNCSTTPF